MSSLLIYGKCVICGNNFKTYSKTKKYCSRNCMKDIYKRNKIINYKKCERCNKKTIPKHTKYCDNCRHIRNVEIEELKKILMKKRWENHREEIKKRCREYYNKSKDNVILKRKRYLCSKNAYMKRYRNDSNFATTVRLRTLLYQALKRYSKNGKVMSSKKYKIDYGKIIEHLKPFPEDISKYHIDHIRPLCSFDLNDKEQIKKAFAPENHQWLLAEENMRKGSKLNWCKE